MTPLTTTVIRLLHCLTQFAIMARLAYCGGPLEWFGDTTFPFQKDRKALHFGNQKINIHIKGQPVSPHALNPTQGSLDICFVCSCDADTTRAFLRVSPTFL